MEGRGAEDATYRLFLSLPNSNEVLLDLDQHIGHKLEKQDGILQETNLQQLNMRSYSL